jgi:DHA1 family bicyclomycin/chloramphenicol resistance-like MFS transporter
MPGARIPGQTDSAMLRPGTFALTALLAGLSAIGPLTTDMYLPSLPDIARQLNASTAQAQFTIAVGQIFYGPVSDRHGRKPILIAAIVLYCIASLACSLSTSIEMLIVARALQALGGCGGIVLARAIVRDIYSGARAGRELSLIASVMALAPVLAPVAGGFLQTYFGWRAVFFTLVAAGFVGVGIVWAALPETLKLRAAEPLSITSILRSYRLVARDPAYLAYLGITAASYAGLFVWISAAAFVLQDLYRLSPSDFGFAFALGSIGYMAGSALAARVVVTFGLDGVLGIGAGTCAAGGIGMVLAVACGFPSSLALVFPMAVYLAGLGMVLPQGIAGALTPFPERAGAASSLFGFVQQSVAALCGAVVGWQLGESAWPLAIGVAAMGCVTLVLWLTTQGIRRAVPKQ